MNIQTYDSPVAVAEAVARITIEALHDTITHKGIATWLLAGGTTPNLAYEIITSGYLDRLDWSKVVLALGDERIGPLDGPDNNWQVIEELFLQHIPEASFLRPKSNLPTETAALDYEQQLHTLPQTENNMPRLDIVWLGMGEDGHTLSLFPNHTDLKADDSSLVLPVYQSPKPPAERISLTPHALMGAQQTFILATGTNKQTALKNALQPDSQLPVAQIARLTKATWLTDISR